jgi:hypothetical protein
MRLRLPAIALAAAALGALPALDADDGAKAPRIRVEPETFDFGRALPGKTLRKDFRIRNFGDAPLTIDGVSTTCGCTAALAAEGRVDPGGATVLRVTLQTRRDFGRVEREVLVRSNDPKTPLSRVRVTATVEAEKPR